MRADWQTSQRARSESRGGGAAGQISSPAQRMRRPDVTANRQNRYELIRVPPYLLPALKLNAGFFQHSPPRE